MFRNFLLIFIFFFSSFTFAERIEVPAEIMETTKDMVGTVNESLGNADKIQRNAHTPLTSDTKLKTYDGSKEFDAKLFCSSSNVFATVMLSTKPNGNLVFQSITQDTDADGTIDRVQTPQWEASAICGNGYMYCSNVNDPQSCRSYKWTANDSNLIGVEQVPMTKLGGCYCINGSCGNNLALSNNQTIMKDISTGMSATLSAKDKFFTMTEVKVDGLYAELKGTTTKGCSAGELAGIGSSESIKLNDYKKDPNKLTNDGFSASTGNSLYTDITGSTKDVGFTQASCEIKRQVSEDRVTLSDIISFDSGSGSLYPMDDNTLRIILGKVGSRYWQGNCSYFDLSTSFFINKPDRIKKATVSRALFDDWLQVHIVNGSEYTHVWNGPYGTWTSPTANVPGNCDLYTNWDMKNINVDFSSAFKKQGPVTFRVRVEVSGEGNGYLQGDIEVDTSCKVNQDTFTDTCKVYAERDNCTLLEETIDEVKTFSNGFPTGLVNYLTNMGEYCGTDQIREWGTIKRKYRCEDNSKWDFDKGFERVDHVKTSIAGEKYGDQIYNEDGTIKSSNSEFTLFNGMDAQACTMTCKTEKPRINNDMNLTGVIGTAQTDPTTKDYFYHQCTGESFNVCPAGEGEVIVKGCACLNEFGDVTSKIQAIRLASQDMICSDGTETQPNGEQ